MKEGINWEDITTLNICAFTKRASKYMRQKTDSKDKGQIHSYSLGLKTLHSVIDRTLRKLPRIMADLNKTINQPT